MQTIRSCSQAVWDSDTEARTYRDSLPFMFLTSYLFHAMKPVGNGIPVFSWRSNYWTRRVWEITRAVADDYAALPPRGFFGHN